MNSFFQSKSFTYLFYAIIILALALLVFRAGMFVGFKKASFMYQHEMRQMKDKQDSLHYFMPPAWSSDPFTASHGTFGIISSLTSSSTFDVKEVDGAEKTVLVSASTSIREATSTVAVQALQPNEHVVVIGTPDSDGDIDAELIRIFIH